MAPLTLALSPETGARGRKNRVDALAPAGGKGWKLDKLPPNRSFYILGYAYLGLHAPEGQWRVAWGKARDGGPTRRPRSAFPGFFQVAPAGAQEVRCLRRIRVLHFHLIFATKDRFPLIVKEWQLRLHAYLGGLVGHPPLPLRGQNVETPVGSLISFHKGG